MGLFTFEPFIRFGLEALPLTMWFSPRLATGKSPTALKGNHLLSFLEFGIFTNKLLTAHLPDSSPFLVSK
jgi:hypothetical protein